jgi:hypothetical protein
LALGGVGANAHRHGCNQRRSSKLTAPKAMTLAVQMAIIHAKEIEVQRLAALEPERLEHQQVARQTDRECRKDEVKGYGERKLRTRQDNRVEMVEHFR